MWGAILRGTAMALVLACVAPAAAMAQSSSPFLELTVSNPVVREGDAAVDATVVLKRSSFVFAAPKMTYRVFARGGSPTGPSDFEPPPGWVTLPALPPGGTQTVRVTARVVGDRYPEPVETFNVYFDDGLFNGFLVATVTIIDTPDPPQPAGRTASTGQRYPPQLLARATHGGLPNAPATEPVLSWDARTTSFAAYTSAATDITPATNGRRNVFVVTRGGAAGKYGTPWQFGTTALASKGRGGQPANGDSWNPALGGWVRNDDAKGPICLAFVSKASNLVRGDGNGRADLFVRKASGGRLRRIASPRGRPASEAAVSGDCRVQGMVAGGALYVTRRGSRKLRKLAGGGVSSPRLSHNGAGISFARSGKVYVLRIGGRVRKIGKGARPTPDGGGTSTRPRGALRTVGYERNGAVYTSTVGGKERLMSPGVSPSTTAGGLQTLFAHGPFVYLYAVSNNFGKQAPQGVCLPDQGHVTKVFTSARGNYVAFACTGGAVILSYIGPK